MKAKLLFFVIMLLGIFSCQKKEMNEEMAAVDIASIKAQSAGIKLFSELQLKELFAIYSQQNAPLTREQVLTVLSKPELKSVTIEDKNWYKFIDAREELVTTTSLTKFVWYKIVDGYNNNVNEYTVSLRYSIVDGKVNTSSCIVDFELGSTKSKKMTINKKVNVWQLSAFTVDKIDGNTMPFIFDFNNNNFDGNVYLPPLEGRYLIIKGFDNNSNQEFITNKIDYYTSKTINILFTPSESNVCSVIEINKELLKYSNTIRFISADCIEGDPIEEFMQSLYSPELPEKILYNSSVKNLTAVIICGRKSCIRYNLVATTVSSGVTTYKIQ